MSDDEDYQPDATSDTPPTGRKRRLDRREADSGSSHEVDSKLTVPFRISFLARPLVFNKQ